MSNVIHLPARTYTPTDEQLAAVAALTALSEERRWVVKAGAFDGVATEPCANDWAHGAGTVTGLPDTTTESPDGMCPKCAVRDVTLAHRDPHWDGRLLDLEVLRAS